MRYVAAYLLIALGGNENPKTTDIEKVLSSVGIESDSEKLNKVISLLSGKNIEETIAKGKEKLATIPSGGAAVAAAPVGAPVAASGGAAPEKKEDKKQVKKEEPEESDDDMGFGLFD